MKRMNLLHRLRPRNRRSSALLITLLILSLITIIAVALLGTMTWETSAARRNYENQRAQALATLGLNSAVAQLRHALDTWDNPYANFATNPPTFYWSVSPGLITRWSYTSATPLTNYPLFSIGSTNLVDLNAAESDGSSPIAGVTNTAVSGATPPNISVYWVNVLKIPGIATASSSNPLIGRYAFWVDDENAKININTADGTMKYTTNSLGIGTPSEVSLQALQQGGANLSATTATNIVYLARTTGLNSPREILRAAGTTPDLYTNNTFNLTAYSRSPDLNVFGQPKMALMPIQGGDFRAATDMVTNGITFQPPVEIYPNPSQLAAYYVATPAYTSSGTWTWYPSTTASAKAVPWPLAFRGQTGLYQNGNSSIAISANSGFLYNQANFYWINGMMLANYLAGTNAANHAITWPTFSGSTAANFKGKYTARQIDSIVAQIVSLGAKAISPDRPQDLDGDNNTESPFQGRSTTDPPLLFGWLSHQWVNGMGRSPKVEAMELGFTTYGSMGSTNSGTYTPPQTTLNILQEWWLPANYLGGSYTLKNTGNYDAMNLSVELDRGVLNSGDLTAGGDPLPNISAPQTNLPAAPLPKAPNDPSGSTNSFWGDQVLANNQGIDFQANPSIRYDPDPYLAAIYHPYALSNGYYYGGAKNFNSGNGMDAETPLEMTAPQAAAPPSTPLQPAAPNGDWAPGELRVISSNYGNLVYLDMQPAADNSTLTVSGGIQVRTETIGLWLSDMDPTPLETIRGLAAANSAGGELFDNESWSSTNQVPGSPAGSTIRDRNIASVIPTSCSMPIPGNHPFTSSESGLGDTEYILATVADPLVNKFPGDWNSATSSSPFPVPSYWPDIDSSYNPTSMTSTNSTTEFSSGFHSKVSRGSATTTFGPDPDSYWMPQEDVPICYLTNVPAQTLIPRSARFPNIGYLQYIRTGIIPDDETQSYAIQHGTPFRLLSYAPSTESANQETSKSGSQSYPDWAMLDLLYIPSILYPYRSPYGYYDITGAWQGYGNAATLSHFSTGGGSTPGRINPNGAVIYTTNVSTPTPGIGRTLPLAAVFKGVMVNQTNNVSTSPTAGYSGGTAVDYSLNESDASSIPVAIERYIRANGPLHMPAELCNVPEIAALRASVNPTRNDLIRQVIGTLTTQSNTFSVWVAGQSILKSKSNTSSLSASDPNWGLYQSGDQVMASVRYHFIVERYLDPGTDGIYGNSIAGDEAGNYGTYDGPSNKYANPPFPSYLYRVVFSEEIR